jgi:hypothetical protein
MDMVVVISQRPGFLADCAQAKSATANRQQPIVIQIRVLCMEPPENDAGVEAAQAYTLSQRAVSWKEKSQ